MNGTARTASRVNRYLGASLEGRPAMLYSAARHLIVHGGKRLRPYMVIKSCQILGGRGSAAMPVAGAIEMVHNFTLIHDDMMDNDEVRHGVSTVHKKFGMPVAILAGDVLFSKAYRAISSSGLPAESVAALTDRLSRACVAVCEGQMLDIRMAGAKRHPTQSQYIDMINRKTAALFEASCSMGAICAAGSPADIANLASFGRNLGVAFQITDDLIGVMGDPKITKKPVGNDLREGKKSLPILMAVRLSKGPDRRAILDVFGNQKASRSDLAGAVGVIRNLGIEEMARKHALEYASKARLSLAGYRNAPSRDLSALLDFVVRRSL